MSKKYSKEYDLRMYVLLSGGNGRTWAQLIAAAIQEESNRKMSLVAENIIKHFEEAMGLVDGLKN